MDICVLECTYVCMTLYVVLSLQGKKGNLWWMCVCTLNLKSSISLLRLLLFLNMTLRSYSLVFMASGRFREPYGMLGNEAMSAACKARAFLVVLWSLDYS